LLKYFKKSFLIVAVNAIILTVLLVLLEITLRLINPNYVLYRRTYPGQYQDKAFYSNNINVNWPKKDSVLGWTCKQESQLKFSNRELNQKNIYYRINKDGFRNNHDFNNINYKNSNRILLLGDSFLFGVYISEEYIITNLMKKKFLNYDFYNLGIPGYGIDQMYLSYLKFGKIIKPQTILLLYNDDDIIRVQEAYRVVEGMNKPSFKPVNDKLVHRNGYDKSIFIELCERSFLLNRFYRKYIEFNNLRIVESIFTKLQDRVKVNNQNLVIIRLPIKEEFHKKDLIERYSLGNFCRNKGIIYYDFYDILNKEIIHEIYFQNDSHFNENGNSIIADKISQLLYKRGLI
jgi:hypothetical protein